MTLEQVVRQLRRANEVARRALTLGRHPFGALLVAPDGETVLAEQGNVDTVNHAESTLARTAAIRATSPEGPQPGLRARRAFQADACCSAV